MIDLSVSQNPPSSVMAETRAKPAIHLAFLDGLRGLAAVYVALFHCRLLFLMHQHGRWKPSLFSHLTNWMGYGHLSVDVFIVLSGFVLMLPVVQSPARTLRGGLYQFALRRGRRILPPYYAALLISTAIVLVSVKLHLTEYKNVFSVPCFWAHVLMLQNVTRQWAFQIDPPLWSVATEWDIYILFALMLLPVWRKFGMVATVLLAFGLGIAPYFCAPAGHNFNWACPWYLGLFALGMLGAKTCYGTDAIKPTIAKSRAWGIATLGGVAAVITLANVFPASDESVALPYPFLLDTLVGATTLALIIYCANASFMGQRPVILRLLTSRVSVTFGTFSYSLYLMHQPLVSSIVKVLGKHLAGSVELAAIIACLPFVIFCTYLFHLAFEKPFLKNRTASSNNT